MPSLENVPGSQSFMGTIPAFDLLRAAIISHLGRQQRGVPGILPDTGHTSVRPQSNLRAETEGTDRKVFVHPA